MNFYTNDSFVLDSSILAYPMVLTFAESSLPYFVRSGNINMSNGRLRNAGINGYNWSTMASSKHNSGSAVPSAYDLGFDATGVYPSHGPNFRWIGFSLRCLARRS